MPSTPKLIFIVAPEEVGLKIANGQENFTRHVDFWLYDGNVIVLAGDTAFRVYKGILAKKSSVFADMFAAGSADATETPELKLHDGQPVSDFAELHTAFHLAHTDQCLEIESRTLSVLKKFYTAHFADYLRYDVSKPSMLCPPREAVIAAVNIARFTDTPSMLPFALYLTCTLEGKMMDGYAQRDGFVEHLAAADIRLCIDAWARLWWEIVSFVKTVFMLETSDHCDTMVAHDGVLDEILEHVEMDTPGALCSLLGSCDAIIRDWVEEYELCAVCMREMPSREVVGRRRAWKLLPGIFGLTAEVCGFATDDGSSEL